MNDLKMAPSELELKDINTKIDAIQTRPKTQGA